MFAQTMPNLCIIMQDIGSGKVLMYHVLIQYILNIHELTTNPLYICNY